MDYTDPDISQLDQMDPAVLGGNSLHMYFAIGGPPILEQISFRFRNDDGGLVAPLP